jgi:hypothetical protein
VLVANQHDQAARTDPLLTSENCFGRRDGRARRSVHPVASITFFQRRLLCRSPIPTPSTRCGASKGSSMRKRRRSGRSSPRRSAHGSTARSLSSPAFRSSKARRPAPPKGEAANQVALRKSFRTQFMRPIARIAKASLKSAGEYPTLAVASRRCTTDRRPTQGGYRVRVVTESPASPRRDSGAGNSRRHESLRTVNEAADRPGQRLGRRRRVRRARASLRSRPRRVACRSP